MNREQPSSACQGVCHFSRRNETLFAALSRRLPRSSAGVCKSGRRKETHFEVCVTLNINWHHQGAALDGLLVPPKKRGSVVLSSPKSSNFVRALPSLVIAASWATTPTLPAVGSKIDTPGTCGFVE